MTLAAFETALVEYVGQVLVDECGRPAPERVLRYHGILPHDCCTEAGFLAASWEPNRSASGVGARNPCPPPPAWPVLLRYVVCWDVPDVGPSGVDLDDPRWDADAAMLADAAECVTRALLRLGCAQQNDDDELVVAVLALTGANGVSWTSTEPITPLGGCAGIAWRVAATLRGETPAS